MKSILIVLIVVSTASGATPESAVQPEKPALHPVARAELLSELRAAPASGSERVTGAVALFKQAGLTNVSKRAIVGRRGRFNVLGTLPGERPEAIFVAAHLDKSSNSRGVIDNWTGVTLVANLAQALAQHETRRHTFVFIAFDLEESGALGSIDYVNRLSPAKRRKIWAMVNLECMGVSDLNAWANGSADSLEELATAVGQATRTPVNRRELFGVNTDSVPFMAAGIPAITFDSLAKKDFQLIDSSADQFSEINHDRFEAQYRFLLNYLVGLDTLDERPTAANRKQRPRKKASMDFMPHVGRQLDGDLVVRVLRPGGTAERGGLKVGDHIITLNGVDMRGKALDIYDIMDTIYEGQSVEVVILRDKKEMTLTIQY